jgi:hypothetical protein
LNDENSLHTKTEIGVDMNDEDKRRETQKFFVAKKAKKGRIQPPPDHEMIVQSQ